MSNTKAEIDFEKILRSGLLAYNTPGLFEQTIEAMQEAIKQAKPIILQEAADKVEIIHAESIGGLMLYPVIDKDSILNLEHSEELNKKLGIL